ncbi:HNH endonuclease [Echinicola strongylocentroti]|uniref:HNH endonuclease n=1 Tax=Echinicola strongylocentroti TaxID=1795355 RepID=A0A2Z4IDQ8_9BACT|nr:HNH endonuclease signature motif containing protein [Echinicola strongylocentroti]AWW29191.1 HNH endonuclease [Echinicola strongylocentroti]
MVSLDDFEIEKRCVYKDEHYSVRDNGAILRHARNDKRQRKYDNIWTFGKPNNNGYMLIVSEVVHRIVAYAFLGKPPTAQHIVDHIDTNRQNNRPENLRWITKLENILLNPITLSRIVYKYGSIDNFLSNPCKPLDGELEQNFEWMRTVTMEESESTKNNLLNWAKQGKIPKGGQLGEWVFSNLGQQTDNRAQKNTLTESLTPSAVQKNWKTPSEFPFCSQNNTANPIHYYTENLKGGEIFSRDQYSNSIISDFAISEDEDTLWVMCESRNENAMKPWSLTQVTYENDLFVHTNLGSFFKKDGAEKQFTLAQGKEWTGGDTFDDYC